MIPDEYKKLSEDAIKNRVLDIKSKLGTRLVILGHHYQRDEVIELSDFRGDSYGLCKKATGQKEAEFIVFCGVHFMAEAADIISNPDQVVQIPDLTAGCPLADFADLASVTQAWQEIESICGTKSITPITYINSSADIKAFCGRNRGMVCTSSNAMGAFKWAFQQTKKLFFFPDQHLGTNTGNKFGIGVNERIVWNPDQPLGGNIPDQIEQAQLILWKGHCHVHTWFNPSHIQTVRKKFPDVKIIVHPECPKDVVSAADDNGSTSYIIQYVQQAEPNSAIAIGTELNLVHRLGKENPDKKIIPLARSICPNMYKINLYNLCWTLDNLGLVNVVQVPNDIQKDALIALNKMLQIN